MIEFNIIDEALVLNDDLTSKATNIVDSILKEVSSLFNINTNHFVSFIIVNNEFIQTINKNYRNIDRPTDVITFANIDSVIDKRLPEELGDIFISYEKVLEQAKEYNHSALREFSFLVTHGILHILGYDHMTKEDEEVMFGLQDKVLNNLNITR